jgi:hypothetical protein
MKDSQMNFRIFAALSLILSLGCKTKTDHNDFKLCTNLDSSNYVISTGRSSKIILYSTGEVLKVSALVVIRDKNNWKTRELSFNIEAYNKQVIEKSLPLSVDGEWEVLSMKLMKQ